MAVNAIPKEFVWRRLHSLMGLWMVLFLMEHLLTNSQAALLLGENGQGFVRMVNWLHNLPYLPFIEGFLLGVPFLIHMVWGVRYLLMAKGNSRLSDGTKPSLQYGRNRAYSWQRITSWILLLGIIGHVAKFRFIDYPTSVQQGASKVYFIPVSIDNGLYSVADRLGVTLYNAQQLTALRSELSFSSNEESLIEAVRSFPQDHEFDEQKQMIVIAAQQFEEKHAWIEAITRYPIGPDRMVAEAPDFGTATLLAVRDTFKSPIYAVLYTIFVLAASFHAFNGFWTFLITWGVILNVAAQRKMSRFAWGVMGLIALFGLVAIWGTYWLNLKN